MCGAVSPSRIRLRRSGLCNPDPADGGSGSGGGGGGGGARGSAHSEPPPPLAARTRRIRHRLARPVIHSAVHCPGDTAGSDPPLTSGGGGTGPCPLRRQGGTGPCPPQCQEYQKIVCDGGGEGERGVDCKGSRGTSQMNSIQGG